MSNKVICDKAKTCREPICGGKEPHNFDKFECGHCPKDKTAKCVQSQSTPAPAETPERASLLTYEQIYDMVKPEMSLPVFLGTITLADLVKVRDAQYQLSAGRISELDEQTEALANEITALRNDNAELEKKLAEKVGEVEIARAEANQIDINWHELVAGLSASHAKEKAEMLAEFEQILPTGNRHNTNWLEFRAKHLNGGAKVP